jgi:GPN-loop GTPase
MTEFYGKFNRKVAIINLDPANENMEYKADVDIMELITVEDVMDKFNLGPNGALMYCMEFLEKNIDWLLQQVTNLPVNYFIFDCPGQVELYTHHTAISNIFAKFTTHRFQLCAVNLIDSHYCSEPNKFIAALLLALNMMLQLGLPHINVFSKADLFKKFEAKLLFGLDYYTEVLDLKYLVDALNES